MINLSREMLLEAIAIYLQCAYPDGRIPQHIEQRIALDANCPMVELLSSAPFENYVAEAPFHCTVHALRLGSASYPHLKMEIRPFPNQFGFVFWVNTHDQFLAPNFEMPDAEGWRDLVQRNRELKQQVERAWGERHLPTFATAMREEAARG